MLDNAKHTLKEKCRLSDKNLTKATKAARFAELWCLSGILFYGIPVLAGLACLGLHALGIGIPAFAGMTTIVIGVAMTAKSALLGRGFGFLHKKALQEQEKRGMMPQHAPALKPAAVPAAVSPISKIAPACIAFNNRARERALQILATLPHPTQKRAKIKTAGPDLRL